MIRISSYLRAIAQKAPEPRVAKPGSTRAPVVLWNILRRCNLNCMHCYSTSVDTDFKGELDTSEALKLIDQLFEAQVKVLIFSGGEPLMRPDLFTLADYAKKRGFYTALSTNGTLINSDNIEDIAAAHFDYVGISIDGLSSVHNHFRRKEGCFEEAMEGIKLCRMKDLKVGLRTSLTQHNYTELPELLALMREYDVQKYYLSHLNYSGRGKKRGESLDAHHKMTREAMMLLFDQAWADVEEGKETDFVSGNNDADAILLLQWTQKNLPQHATQMEKMLRAWGGNSSGAGIANIDNLGNVHPDSYMWQHTIGNIREKSFADIWFHQPDPLLLDLRKYPRAVKGRCQDCHWLEICNGNTRTRAWAQGDFWGEDPGCYLSDDEIGSPLLH
ncbi:heme d1 biosynthesis radical SAM protein NirJ [Ignatzschineria sp. LJL83]